MLRHKARTTTQGLAVAYTRTTPSVITNSSPILFSRSASKGAYFDEAIKPQPNPLNFVPPEPFVSDVPLPSYSPVFPSGVKFVPVDWTLQKTKEIKRTRFEIALGAFKMGNDVPYLSAYQEIHAKKGLEQARLDKEEEIEEKRKERAFKKSVHGYEEYWQCLWSSTLFGAHVPYPDPLPSEEKWASIREMIQNPESYRPYGHLNPAAAVRKYLREEWGKFALPTAKTFGGWHGYPGLERRFLPYIVRAPRKDEYPDPWNAVYWDHTPIGSNFLRDGDMSNPSEFDYTQEELEGLGYLGGDDKEEYEDEEGEEGEEEEGEKEEGEEDDEYEEEEYEDEDEEEEGEEEDVSAKSKLSRKAWAEMEKEAEADKIDPDEGECAFPDALWAVEEFPSRIDLDEGRNDPEHLSTCFRQLMNAKRILEGDKPGPRTIPVPVRTAADRKKIREEKQLYQEWYELDAANYVRQKLAQHGLIAPEAFEDTHFEIVDEDEGEDVISASTAREVNNQFKQQQKEDETPVKDWLSEDLAAEDPAAAKQAEYQALEDQLLTTIDQHIVKDNDNDPFSNERAHYERKLVLWRKYAKQFIKEVRTHPPRPVKEFPLEFITNTSYDPDIIMGPLARKKFVQRKVILKLHVPSLGLPSCVVERLKLLTGRRFDEKTQVLKIVADKHPNKHLNRRYAIQLVKELISNAMLADPSYVPLTDLSLNLEDVLPRPKLPTDLEEDLHRLTAPPILLEDEKQQQQEQQQQQQQEQQEQTQAQKEWEYRLFHFNFYKPRSLLQQESTFHHLIRKSAH